MVKITIRHFYATHALLDKFVKIKEVEDTKTRKHSCKTEKVECW